MKNHKAKYYKLWWVSLVCILKKAKNTEKEKLLFIHCRCFSIAIALTTTEDNHKTYGSGFMRHSYSDPYRVSISCL